MTERTEVQLPLSVEGMNKIKAGIIVTGLRKTYFDKEDVGHDALTQVQAAEIIGISVDWYRKIEQGRAKTVKVRTVDSIAFGLRAEQETHMRLLELNGYYSDEEDIVRRRKLWEERTRE